MCYLHRGPWLAGWWKHFWLCWELKSTGMQLQHVLSPPCFTSTFHFTSSGCSFALTVHRFWEENTCSYRCFAFCRIFLLLITQIFLPWNFALEISGHKNTKNPKKTHTELDKRSRWAGTSLQSYVSNSCPRKNWGRHIATMTQHPPLTSGANTWRASWSGDGALNI